MSETLIALGTETPPPLSGVPAPLSKFVARLMARDPAGRPKDAGAALAELSKVEAQLANSDEQPDRGSGSGRKLIYAALGTLVVLLAVVAGVLLTRDKPKDGALRPEDAPLPVLQQPAPTPSPSPSPNPDTLKPPVVPPKSADPAGRLLSSAEVLKLIAADIDAHPGPKAGDDKPTRLYLFAPHLAPGSSLFATERKAYRDALAALSAQLKPGGDALRPLDKDRTVFAVEPAGEFRLPDGLFSGYPYGLTFEKPESAANDDAFIRAYTGPVAFVRADWFVRYARSRLRSGKDAVFGASAPVPRPVEEWARYWDTTPFTVFPAADELGVDKEAVKGAIRRHEPLTKTYGIGPLADGKTVLRARWESREFATSAFQELARELGLGQPVLTK